MKEILEELRAILTGKTLDAILPPFVFVFVNARFGLTAGALSAQSFALAVMILRVLRGQNWRYAAGGLVAVGLAGGMAVLSRDAANYFLSALVGSTLLVLAALGSLVIGKPLAAWASHLTRGWPLDWFARADVRPAYVEVTWLWFILLAARLAAQWGLYRSADPVRLAWANALLGWPVTIAVLITSYVYGIWRLRRLGGPGVDEFIAGKAPPWRGQVRGF